MIYVDVKDNIKAFLASVGTATKEQLVSFFKDAAPERAIEGSIKELRMSGVIKEEEEYYRLMSSPKLTREEIRRRLLVLDCLSQLHSKDVIAIQLYQYPVYFIVATEDGFMSYSLVRQVPDKLTIDALLRLSENTTGEGNIKHYAVVLEYRIGKEVSDIFDGYFLVTKEGATLYESKT